MKVLSGTDTGQSTTQLLSISHIDSATTDALISNSTAQKLNELATKKLAEAIRKSKTNETGWDGYDKVELLAAQALLSQDTESFAR